MGALSLQRDVVVKHAEVGRNQSRKPSSAWGRCAHQPEAGRGDESPVCYEITGHYLMHALGLVASCLVHCVQFIYKSYTPSHLGLR